MWVAGRPIAQLVVDTLSKGRNLGHTDDFNVTFGRTVGVGVGHFSTALGEGRNSTGVVVGVTSNASRTAGTDVGSPLIVGRHHEVEVESVLGVGAATQTNFDDLSSDRWC